MSRTVSDEIVHITKQLIHQISGYQDGTDQFKHYENYFKTQFKKSDSMYFLNKKQMDEAIDSMGQKFSFHGFNEQAKELKTAFNKYVPEDLNGSELLSRLNVVKFLLCMSHSPTTNFHKNFDKFMKVAQEEESKIDWGAYLLSGMEPWTQNFASHSEDSDSSSATDEADESTVVAETLPCTPPNIVMTEPDLDEILDLKASRDELYFNVQHHWYSKNFVFDEPESNWSDANIGILWEKYLKEQVNGLIPVKCASVISEYKVLREIFWQMWEPHSSTVFEFNGNKLVPKANVTISSVRSIAFEKFCMQFIPYIEALDFFREFSIQLEIENKCVTGTYRSYANSVNNIIKPVYDELIELEETVRKQEQTFTLLKLASHFKVLFEPVLALKKIHDEIVIDFKKNTAVECATTLLVRLHNGLLYSANKLEQDLKLTLFLDSLFHYFMLIDNWLMKDDLTDYGNEFVILNNNITMQVDSGERQIAANIRGRANEFDNFEMNFYVRNNISAYCKSNNIIKLICGPVLQIGRNIHLLRLLGKYNIINDSVETVHEEFVRICMEQLCKYYNRDVTEVLDSNKQTDYDDIEETEKHPLDGDGDSNKITGMNSIDNLVDTNDGLIMLAFADYFENGSKKMKSRNDAKKTLYEKISDITTSLFPIQRFFENIFDSILKDRFTISGLMVKTLLIEQYKLDRQFEFLRHLFLFSDDIIFPFYRRFFEKMETACKNWGNEVWLTSHLQDIIMDIYPDFYENCSVHVKENGRSYTDTLDACNIINLHHNVQWPLNIVIVKSHMNMYRELFQFILKIKWALYTVNHLSFADIEPKQRQKIVQKSNKMTMKLKYLKFSLINIINSIQHYIFGFAINKCLMNFELEFEKANDLSSIITAHEEFICSVHRMVVNVRDCGEDKSGCNTLFQCVKLLKKLWTDPNFKSLGKLEKCFELYQRSFNVVNPVINPIYIFDY